MRNAWLMIALATNVLAKQDSFPAWAKPLIGFRPRQELRVATAAQQVFIGDSIALLPGTIRMVTFEGVRRSFPFDSIAGAWRRSDGSRTGFLIGGGIGAAVSVVGGAYGAGFAYQKYTTLDAIRTGAIGALLFGCVGYIIGVFIPSWDEIYRR